MAFKFSFEFCFVIIIPNLPCRHKLRILQLQLQLKIHKCNNFNNRMQHQTEEQCNNLKHYGHQTVLVDHMVVGQNNPFHSEADDRKWQQTSYISPRFHRPIKTESWQMPLHLFHVKKLVSFFTFYKHGGNLVRIIDYPLFHTNNSAHIFENFGCHLLLLIKKFESREKSDSVEVFFLVEYLASNLNVDGSHNFFRDFSPKVSYLC